MEISKMLTISTAHISEETANHLKRNGLFVPCYEFEYGFFVFVQEGIEDANLPQDLKNCLILAKEHGCSWLQLDCDGDYVEGLEKYDW